MMDNVMADDSLMRVKIFKKGGAYKCSIRVVNGIINEWDLGTDEDVAKAKAKSIVDTYIEALNKVQTTVQEVYAEKADK